MIRIVYVERSFSRTQCFEWFRRFKNRRESIEDDSRSGRPSISTDDSHVKRINDLVRSNRRLTIREMADDYDISFVSLSAGKEPEKKTLAFENKFLDFASR